MTSKFEVVTDYHLIYLPTNLPCFTTLFIFNRRIFSLDGSLLFFSKLRSRHDGFTATTTTGQQDQDYNQERRAKFGH